MRRKERTLSVKLVDIIKDWRQPLFWLVLLIIFVVIVDYRHAPLIILFKAFRYLLLAFLMMFMPFVTGLAGFTRPVRTAWFVNVVLVLTIAGLYYTIYGESIWRIWYRGSFDRQYMMGLLEAATIVPGISFIIGFAVRCCAR